MQRQIAWVERMADGTRREVRVRVMRGAVKWQFLLSTAEGWDYSTPPSAADWDQLLERMENRYCRNNIAFKDLELVRRLRPAGASRAPA